MVSEKTPLQIGLLGEGKLYKALKHSLAGNYYLHELQRETFSSQLHDIRLVIVCHERWSEALRSETQTLGQMQKITWLPIYGEFDAVFLGPCTQSDTAGCFACAEYRRLCAIGDRELFMSMRERLEQENRSLSQPWLTSWGLQVLLPFIEAEVAALSGQTTEARTLQAVLQLNLSTLQWMHHRFLPNPTCPLCGKLSPDSAEAASIQLQPRQKPRPTTFRTRSLREMIEPIGKAYVDGTFGLIHQISKYSLATCAITNARAHVEHQGWRRDLPGTGRTFDYQQSHLAAIAEALERYGGQLPHSKSTMVRASFRQLGEQALDPITLGLHGPEQYAQPGFRYTPYQPDLVCNWVWGYSFSQQRPLLVPESYAYYGYPEEHAFAYEISNGCALGNCLEEAILYALLEILERDAFLLTWYAQLGVPRLDCSTIPSQQVRWMIEHLEYLSGYTISVFNTTMLHGAACCWVMGVDEGRRPGFPRMVCTAGSHILPEEAILNALLELLAALQPQRLQELFQLKRQNAVEMMHDSQRVEGMEDHSLLYMLPEAFTRLDFLMQTSRQQTFQEAFDHLLQPALSLNLTEDLTRLIDHYQAQGVDTIVVDQTTPEQRKLGFHCAKVIMPGMLPMTFGHQYRRVHGFKRLAEWPVLLGYHTEPLTEGQINPYPHPFP